MDKYTKDPKTLLLQFTKHPMELMSMVRRVMHSPIPDSLEEFMENPERWLGMSLDKYIEDVLMNDNMATFLEYVNVTFKMENVSRALQTQLIRHRIGFSYSIQSMRCVDLPNFASDGLYHMPDTVKDKEAYHQKMLNIEKDYRQALKDGVPTQDARGLLPLNIYSTITFSASLRALIGMLNKRLCKKTQGEFRTVAMLMMEEIKKKMDPRIMKWIGPPCQVQGYCMMKGENEEQYQKGMKSGKQNTDHVCPLYVSIFKKRNKKC